MENVHSVGNVSEGHEGADDDDDEAGRDRCDLRQVQGEGGAYPTNKTEQTRGRQKELYVSMEVDHISGSEPQEEDLGDVDEVQPMWRRSRRRRRGRQPKKWVTTRFRRSRRSRRSVDRLECGGDQGGKGGREYHTHREVEEGTGRPGCRSKYWAREDPRSELHVSREGLP